MYIIWAWRLIMINICEDYFCVYYKDERCTLDYISLNHNGMCTNSVHVYLDNDDLKEIRRQQRDRINNAAENIKDIFKVK